MSNTLVAINKLQVPFIELIQQRLGLIIHSYQLNDLNKTILEACNTFHYDASTYLKVLETCTNDSPFLEFLVAGITVGETYFFRDKNQMQFLQEMLLPQIIKSKQNENNLSLRIWSAGSSSGEEIYTIAMILLEIIPSVKSWALQLMGTDINTLSLQKAISGIYSGWSMRSIPDSYKKKYFIQKENMYYLKPEIKSMVSFSYLNLKSDDYPSIFNNTNSQDLILCRNVLIYFDNHSIDQLMQKLGKSLVPGGFLMLGSSDPINIKNTLLSLYQHKSICLINNKADIPISKTEPIKKPAITHTRKAPNLILPSSHKKITVNESTINQLITQSRWEQILSVLDSHETPHTSFMLNAKATALANLGKLQQAVQLCENSLLADPTNKHTYFIFAVILMELNQLPKAENLLRKTLFLDHQFVEGHFQLGLLLIRDKRHDAGLKCLQNALAIAKNKSPTEIVSEFHGLDFGRLAEILSHEIDLYQSQRN